MAPADRHGWNELGNAIIIHERRLQSFLDEGFVITHNVQVRVFHNRAHAPVAVKIAGRILCVHHLFLDVETDLDVMQRGGRAWVRLADCKYHAGVSGNRARTIFRYDTSHPYPDHPDNYHKHLFDHETWTEIDTPVWIGRSRWPDLSEVLEELHIWWTSIGQYLALP